MIAIEVYRGSGTHRGDDIIDPLIGSDVCAISRGRNELDVRAPRDTLSPLRTTSWTYCSWRSFMESWLQLISTGTAVKG